MGVKLFETAIGTLHDMKYILGIFFDLIRRSSDETRSQLIFTGAFASA
jgi:hypothetical protein